MPGGRELSVRPDAGPRVTVIPRTDVTFDSAGLPCAAWLYRPSTAAPYPIVVLAHGFGLTREAKLDAYARRFVRAGYAALVFDYRHFGDSAGEPRELLDIDAQLDDWRAALAFVRGLPDIDRSRIALWGTSFSGGHVAAVAAEDRGLAALISQVPYSGLGGRGRVPDLGFLGRMVVAALRDELAGRRGGAAHIPLVAEPGGQGFAAFVRPGALHGMLRLLPEGHRWTNRFTPRVTLRMPRYRPFDPADRISAPWLVLVCDRDSITPADQAAARASRAPRVQIRRLPYEHFEIYLGRAFEESVTAQLDFLAQHLGPWPVGQ